MCFAKISRSYLRTKKINIDFLAIYHIFYSNKKKKKKKNANKSKLRKYVSLFALNVLTKHHNQKIHQVQNTTYLKD